MIKAEKRILKGIVCIILISALLLMYTSCSLKVSAEELSGEYERKATDSVNVNDAYIYAMADFAMNLFVNSLGDNPENKLVSPLSAVVLIAMIANGAEGETLVQIEKALGMSIGEFNRYMYSYMSGLYSSDDCNLKIADSIWFRNTRIKVKEDFLQTNADWYNAQIYSAEFDNGTVNDINKWVNYYSDGMIERIIDEIAESEVMYLINALAFDAEWQDKYEKKDINEHIFTGYDNVQTAVQMLFSEESVYLSDENAVGFSKNYKGEKYSFVAMLPDEGVDIYDYARSLNGEKWMSIWNGRKNQSVQVGIPEFTCSSYTRLNSALEKMGVTDMFDSGAADFSGIGSVDNGKIFCAYVDQKTFIQLDRNGTKAATVTWGAMSDGGAPEYTRVILERPFIYAIVDNSTGIPLFTGIALTMNQA